MFNFCVRNGNRWILVAIITGMAPLVGLELTILTNLLFIMIPQGYLLCAKLFMILDESFILISSNCVSFF